MGYLLTNISRIWETFLEAVGGHLALGLGGILFLGFPVGFWCGAYGYAIAAHNGIALIPAVLIGLALSVAVGIIFAFFYARMSNDSFAVITLASVLAMEALLRSWDSMTGGVLGITGVPRLPWAHALEQLALLEGTIVLIVFIAESFLVHSAFGRSLRALKENKTALLSMGTSANVTGQMAIIFACLSVGVAGILASSRIQFLDPSLGGIFLLVQVLTIVIIANSPKTLRFFGMTIVITLIPEVLRFLNVPSSILGYTRNLLYALLLVILLYYGTYKSATKRNV